MNKIYQKDLYTDLGLNLENAFKINTSFSISLRLNSKKQKRYLRILENIENEALKKGLDDFNHVISAFDALKSRILRNQSIDFKFNCFWFSNPKIIMNLGTKEVKDYSKLRDGSYKVIYGSFIPYAVNKRYFKELRKDRK